ncbi:MAG TPA: hypothetical protein VGG97_08615 [Bryobacteraceae bacterium]
MFRAAIVLIGFFSLTVIAHGQDFSMMADWAQQQTLNDSFNATWQTLEMAAQRIREDRLFARLAPAFGRRARAQAVEEFLFLQLPIGLQEKSQFAFEPSLSTSSARHPEAKRRNY